MVNVVKTKNPRGKNDEILPNETLYAQQRRRAIFPVMGVLVSIKAVSEHTGGVFNLFEVSCPPLYATPLLIHYTEDVAIFVLDGKLAFFWGGEKKEAIAGSFFYQPRGTPHGFRVEGGTLARILYMTIPAGFDRFVIEQELLDPSSKSVLDAARYKIEILGPLPE